LRINVSQLSQAATKGLNTKHMRKELLMLLVAFCPVFLWAQQVTITGQIKDARTNDPLIGATVLVQGTGDGAAADLDGNFEIRTQKADEYLLVVNFMGYATQEVKVTDPSAKVSIEMEEAGLQLETVNVKGRRLSEERQKEPLTMETLDLVAIKETPAVSFYEGLGNLSGVDLTTASLGFTVVNTRGFNSTSPVRSLQLIDGVDNQSPGLNFSLGNFLGSPELDILKVDLVQGAASAFYGPNAFNGVIAMETKDPFIHKGLGAMIKVGERNLLETAIRWADAFNNKKGNPVFAYKFNFSYLTANDWEAENYIPIDGSEVSSDNPGGFDAVNVYGDEFFPLNDATGTQPWSDEAGLGTWFRTGYREIDLVDYTTENIKANFVGSFRLNPSKEAESTHLTFASSFGSGTTVYQGDNRFRLEDILFFQNRLELHKKDKFFLRLYATNEDAGNSYDPYATALRLQENAKESEDWSQDYRSFWKLNINNRMRSLGYPQISFDPVTGTFTFDREAANQWINNFQDSLRFWHGLAEQYANSIDNGYLAPGTEGFDAEFNRLIKAKNNEEEEGTLFFDRSALYHAQGEYRWDVDFLDDFRTGFSSRLYAPNSDGTIFIDTAGRTITNFEYGFYTGFDKNFFNDELIISASLRVDKNQNFDFVYSPAASLVWNPIEDNYLRFSFSSALRNPTLADQYLSLNVGPAILSGNLEGADSLITLESFDDYRNTLNSDTLEYFNIDPIRPERVQTFELGYRTILWEDVFIDAGYYFNIYQDFLGFNIGIDADLGTNGLIRDLQVFRYSANSTQRITTQGFNIGVKYFFDKLSLSGNYSWNKLNSFEEDPIIPAFNTPEHKFNISFGGRNMNFVLFGRAIKNISFNVNYKWVDGFLFEGSPQFTGFIPSYDLLDAQISWRAEKINTTFKLGASNVLNQEQFQTYGGPRIGRLAYLSATYDWKKDN
jgi:outer membrane receptor protein involved in Fe transport